MFGIGETELLIIVAFGFMIFGPDKLPGMGRTLGRALRQFRQAQRIFRMGMRRAVGREGTASQRVAVGR